jgi:hypothetical protein
VRRGSVAAGAGMLRPFCTLALVIPAGCTTMASRVPQAETYYFDCDVPAERSAEWNRTVSGREVRVSGAIELIEPRRDPRWEPVANVFVSGNEESSVVGFRLFLDWHAPELVHISLMAPSGTLWDDALVSRSWRGESIPFTFSFIQSGELKLTAAGKSQSARPVAFKLQKVRLSCSSGQFKFTGVSVDITD